MSDMDNRVVRRMFEGVWYLGRITSTNPPYVHVEYEDGDQEELDDDELAESLISDDAVQVRFEDVGLVAISRDGDSIKSIAAALEAPDEAEVIAKLNRIRRDIKLQAFDRIALTDGVVQKLRNGLFKSPIFSAPSPHKSRAIVATVPETSLCGRVVRRNFGGSWFLGRVASTNPPYVHVEYEDGDNEELDQTELAESLIPDDIVQVRLEDNDGHQYLVALTRDNDTVDSIAASLQAPQQAVHIVNLNSKRYRCIGIETKLKVSTLLLLPEGIAMKLREGVLGSKVNHGIHGHLVDLCQACNHGFNGKHGITTCASLGCGARLHSVCCDSSALARPHYFCARCMAIPLEEELMDLDFSARPSEGASAPLLRFGNARKKSNTVGFGIVNSRTVSPGSPLMTASSSSIGVEAERRLLKLCALAANKAPALAFTSIVVNSDSKFSLHCDSQNVGLSGIVGLGGYSGGDLYVDWMPAVTPDGAETITQSPHEKDPGGFFDIRNKCLVFNGQAPHLTTAFQGERFTVVYYTRSNWEMSDKASQNRLKQLYVIPCAFWLARVCFFPLEPCSTCDLCSCLRFTRRGFNFPSSEYMERWSAIDYGDEEDRLDKACKGLIKAQEKRGRSTQQAIHIHEETPKVPSLASQDGDFEPLVIEASTDSAETATTAVATTADTMPRSASPLEAAQSMRLALELDEIRTASLKAEEDFTQQGKRAFEAFHTATEDIVENFRASGQAVAERALDLSARLARRVKELELENTRLREQVGKRGSSSSTSNSSSSNGGDLVCISPPAHPLRKPFSSPSCLPHTTPGHGTMHAVAVITPITDQQRKRKGLSSSSSSSSSQSSAGRPARNRKRPHHDVSVL